MASAVENLSQRVEGLREGLDWGSSITTDACGVLDQYLAHVSKLERAVQPVAATTQALLRARENIRKARERAEEVLEHLDTSRKVEGRIMKGPRSDLDSFLKALERLEEAIRYLGSHRNLQPSGTALEHAVDLQRDAMRLCMDDFVATLRAHPAALPPPSPANGMPTDADLMPLPAQQRLQQLAAVMLRQQPDTSCFKVYCEVRRSSLERVLMAHYSPGEDLAKLGLPQLERKVQGWSQALAGIVWLVAGEARLSQAIFLSPYNEAAFIEVVTKSLMGLVQFGMAIVHARRTPEKACLLLEMHGQMEAQMIHLIAPLQTSNGAPLLQELLGLHFQLQRETLAAFNEFDASIARDPPRNSVADGTVHPLTASTLSFLKRLFSYVSAPRVLFAEDERGPIPIPQARTVFQNTAALAASLQGGGGGILAALTGASPPQIAAMARAISRILDTLQQNLVLKAGAYKNKALAAIFLMNNINYLVKAAEASELLAVLGQGWLEQRRDQVEAYGAEYQNMSWGELIKMVKADTNVDRQQITWTKEKTVIKEKFRTLNQTIQALHEVQSAWIVPDPLLRRNLKDAIAEDFLPFYLAFFNRYKVVPFSKTPDKYLRYGMETIQKLLMEDFFEGKEGSALQQLPPA
ncbi:hypothetical protein WJX74_001369 [Apatococcus lobatus]|uniref:Exocyst subunit Exo70 family protein n=1 Tax=Apatococcus lobatus TaxID=904363 RepID=A0AAW1Q8Y7_9CHLO